MMQVINDVTGKRKNRRPKHASSGHMKKHIEEGVPEEIIYLLFLSRKKDEKLLLYSRSMINSFSRQKLPDNQLLRIRKYIYSSFLTC
jgi:hypothetical protein